MIKIPYWIDFFKKIIEENLDYIDRTNYLQILENLWNPDFKR